MKSNEVKALEARLEHLKKHNRPEKAVREVRVGMRAIISYEGLIKKYASKPELCIAYANKIREIFEALIK